MTKDFPSEDSDQPAWASAQSDHSICWVYEEFLRTELPIECIVKALMWLGLVKLSFCRCCHTCIAHGFLVLISESTDEPVHPHSLARAFAAHTHKVGTWWMLSWFAWLCLCFVSLPHGTMGLSAVCDCDISWSYSLFMYGRCIFIFKRDDYTCTINTKISCAGSLFGLDARKPVFGGSWTTQAQTNLRIPAVWSAPLLFAFWKVLYVNLLQAKFQFTS